MNGPAYFERVAHGYLGASRTGLWGRVRAVEWRTIRALLDLEPGMDVLDAGCGAGHYSLLLRDEGARVDGLDASHAMMVAYRGLGFEGHLDAMETFRTGERYDRILLAGVMEFLERPDLALENLAHLLRTDGILVCLVPAAGLAGAAYEAVHRLQGCPTFIREPSWYLRLAEQGGLEVSRCERATWISTAFALRRARRG